MEEKSLKDVVVDCDCKEKTGWVNLVAKKYAKTVLETDVANKDYKVYFDMRKKFTDEVLYDTQGAFAKILLQLILALFPEIDWATLKDNELEDYMKDVWDTAARIPAAAKPPQP